MMVKSKQTMSSDDRRNLDSVDNLSRLPRVECISFEYLRHNMNKFINKLGRFLNLTKLFDEAILGLVVDFSEFVFHLS